MAATQTAIHLCESASPCRSSAAAFLSVTLPASYAKTKRRFAGWLPKGKSLAGSRHSVDITASDIAVSFGTGYRNNGKHASLTKLASSLRFVGRYRKASCFSSRSKKCGRSVGVFPVSSSLRKISRTHTTKLFTNRKNGTAFALSGYLLTWLRKFANIPDGNGR